MDKRKVTFLLLSLFEMFPVIMYSLSTPAVRSSTSFHFDIRVGSWPRAIVMLFFPILNINHHMTHF